MNWISVFGVLSGHLWFLPEIVWAFLPLVLCFGNFFLFSVCFVQKNRFLWMFQIYYFLWILDLLRLKQFVLIFIILFSALILYMDLSFLLPLLNLPEGCLIFSRNWIIVLTTAILFYLIYQFFSLTVFFIFFSFGVYTVFLRCIYGRGFSFSSFKLKPMNLHEHFLFSSLFKLYS